MERCFLMSTFLVSLVILIVGYFIYGKIVDTVFGPTDNPTPAVRINDGVDYMPLPTWKVFLIQLLIYIIKRIAVAISG